MGSCNFKATTWESLSAVVVPEWDCRCRHQPARSRSTRRCHNCVAPRQDGRFTPSFRVPHQGDVAANDLTGVMGAIWRRRYMLQTLVRHAALPAAATSRRDARLALAHSSRPVESNSRDGSSDPPDAITTSCARWCHQMSIHDSSQISARHLIWRVGRIRRWKLCRASDPRRDGQAAGYYGFPQRLGTSSKPRQLAEKLSIYQEGLVPAQRMVAYRVLSPRLSETQQLSVAAMNKTNACGAVAWTAARRGNGVGFDCRSIRDR